MDFKNFGQSQGDFRGYISSFEDSLKEAEGFVDFILAKYKNKPKVNIHHSKIYKNKKLAMILNDHKPQPLILSHTVRL